MARSAEAQVYSGLYSIGTEKEAACPLQRVEAHAVIGEGQAITTITQFYLNGTGEGLEALYRFPLPYDSVVTRFSARIGDAAVEGRLAENEQARKRYEEAVKAGDAAMLLQRNSPDVFDISVGNIAAGEEVEITIEYWQGLKAVDGACRYALPMALAPRYLPQGERGEGAKILPFLGETEYRLSFTADVDLGSDFAGASSPSHDIAVSANGNGQPSIALKSPALLDSDLLLDIALKASAADTYTVEEGPVGNYICIKFAIEADGGQPMPESREYIFVLDASGSMDGAKLSQAKLALSLCLRNMMPGDLFNLVAFGSDFKCFSVQSVSYGQAGMARAEQWLSSIGSMGGTEILAPLRHIYAKGALGMPREILLFTDGQVGNEQQIIDLVKEHGGTTRFFPFGIDTAVNRHFIDGLARAGGGEPEYIHPGERIDDKVIRQFSRISETPVTDVRYEGAHPSGAVNLRNASPSGSIPSTLYAGEEYSFCFNLGFRPVPCSISVSGRLGAQPFLREIPLKHTIGWQGISKRWARERIAFLEAEGSAGRNKPEIVDVSLHYGVISRSTSYLAHIERKDKVTGKIRSVIVPSALPALWEEQHAPRLAGFMPSMASLLQSSPSASFNRISYAAPSMSRVSRAFSDTDAVSCSFSMAGESPRDNIDDEDPIVKAVKEAALLQRADGSAGKDTRSTAFFLLGMLFSGRYKPLRNQLRKAAEYLMSSEAGAGLTEAVAILFASEKNLADPKRSAAFVEELSKKLGANEKQRLADAQAGNYGKALDFAGSTSENMETIALALLDMARC